MKIRQYIALGIGILAVWLTSGLSVSAQSVDSEFPFPTLPTEFDSETSRANYIVTHFWDRVKLDTAIKNRDGFKNAFINFMLQTPFAEQGVAEEAIDKLIKAYDKNPDGLLTLAQIAEETLYAPGAIFVSDEYYLPFATAVARAKKINVAEKARFARQSDILSGCRVGVHAPDFKYTLTDGSKGKLSDLKGKYVILFVNDPTCEDCALARVRLTVDSNINKFIDAGKLALLCVYPDEPDAEWRAAAESYSRRWTVGASPDLDDKYDLRSTPTIYYINSDGLIMSKSISVEQLSEGFARIAQP